MKKIIFKRIKRVFRWKIIDASKFYKLSTWNEIRLKNAHNSRTKKNLMTRQVKSTTWS